MLIKASAKAKKTYSLKTRKMIYRIIAVSAILISIIACSNNESKTTDKQRENQAEPIIKTTSSIRSNPNSVVDKALIGNWNIHDDLVYGTKENFLQITDKLILKEGKSISGNTANLLIAKDGQISYELASGKAWLYSYALRNDSLFLLSSPTEVFVNPIGHKRSIILTKE
jgi:hypothetical protein